MLGTLLTIRHIREEGYLPIASFWQKNHPTDGLGIIVSRWPELSFVQSKTPGVVLKPYKFFVGGKTRLPSLSKTAEKCIKKAQAKHSSSVRSQSTTTLFPDSSASRKKTCFKKKKFFVFLFFLPRLSWKFFKVMENSTRGDKITRD